MTTIHAQAERKRQDRSVCRAEKRLCRARMLRVRGLIHPTSAVCATTDTARGEKRLPSEQNQAILKSSGRPLGECRLKGVGIIYGAEPVLRPHLESGALRIVLEDWASMGSGFHAYYPGRRQVPTALRLLIDLIREIDPIGRQDRSVSGMVSE